MTFFKVIGNASAPYVTNTFLVYMKKKNIYRIIDQLARVKYAWCYVQKRLRTTCMYFVKRNKKRSPRCFIFNTSTYLYGLYAVSLYTTLLQNRFPYYMFNRIQSTLYKYGFFFIPFLNCSIIDIALYLHHCNILITNLNKYEIMTMGLNKTKYIILCRYITQFTMIKN